MHTQKVAIIIIAAIGMLTTFMPWVNAPLVGGIDGTDGDGWITMSVFAIPIILCLINDKTAPLTGFRLYAAVIPPILIAMLTIWKIIDLKAKIAAHGHDHPFTEMFGTNVSIGFGLYLLVLAAFALPIAAFIIKDKTS